MVRRQRYRFVTAQAKRRGPSSELLIFGCGNAPLRGQRLSKPPALLRDTYLRMSYVLPNLNLSCRSVTSRTRSSRAGIT